MILDFADKFSDYMFEYFVITERDNDRFILVNDKFSNIMQYSKRELTSQSLYNFILEEDICKTKEFSLLMYNGEKVDNFINRYKTKNGKIVIFKWNFVEINGYFFNFAELVEDENSFILSKDNFSQLFENSGTTICLVDLQGNFIDVSTGCKEMWGYERQELIGMSYNDITHNEDKKNSESKFKDLLNGDLSHYQTRKRYIHKDGSDVHAILDVVLLRNIKNEPAYIISQVQNITELVKAENKIEEMNRQLVMKNKNLESFAYAASHDLQEPLRKITAFSYIITEQISKACLQCSLYTDMKENLKSISSASSRMARLIDDLLEYSRIGRFDFESEKVNLNEVVDEVKEFLSMSMEEKRVLLEVDNLPIIFSNKAKLIQLFQNLIYNAIKFSKKGHNPIIKINYIKDDNLICIEDNGIGLESSYYEKIFLPFERLHGRSEYEGSGMGLALCKGIVDNIGGEIWVESEVGKGSKFFISIPKNKVFYE